MEKSYKGSCLCGETTYSVSGFSQLAANCHCTMCRKFHGAAFGTLVGVSDFKWLSGQQWVKEYVASNGTTRTFCSHCGSSLGFRVKDAPLEQIELAISTFDEDIPVTVDAQIYTSYKANWCPTQENLTTFPEGR
ncbi:GFA family protein [Vibrio sp. 10N.261.55.A7]|uniref:GFA family protein n=1 Tax=Vibrio TaxID=662 RepID=UPI000C8223DE|nr:GFA family protein [Vibrio sp. 10N.261.55.A7]PMJ99103.1 glutathione-dependent formaldehyde-activating GFA [Vibrio sp. 10N.261.55.A7]